MSEPWSADRLELGEGARWIGDGLLLVDILAGRLLRLDPGERGPLKEVLRLDAPLGAVAPVRGRPGRHIAAAGTGIALLDGDGADWIARPEAGAPVPMRMNDGCCDPRGRFWAGSTAYDGTRGAGTLYRVDPDRTLTPALRGYTVPNGPAFTADGARMYLADSAEGRIDVCGIGPDGQIGDVRVFTRVEDGSPDGMQVDAEGCLWVAVWGAGRVHRYAPDGTLVHVVRLPAAQPTSVCVVGTDAPVLFITSAAFGLNRPAARDGAVFALPVDVPAPRARAFGAAS
ncbi:SMP-30/gluconolactonase/LRE family protein [Nocardiopsis coralliicola]